MALSQIINIPGPRGNAEEKKHYLTFRKGMLSQNRPNELHTGAHATLLQVTA